MRHDVEAIYIDERDYTDIELPNAVSGQGAVVPIVIEGRGGGNTTQLYVAIFEILKPDFSRLRDLGGDKDDHPRAALLAYDQIDTLRWRYVDWRTRTIDRNRITIPACELPYVISQCPPETQGKIIIEVNGAGTGPNLQIINDPR